MIVNELYVYVVCVLGDVCSFVCTCNDSGLIWIGFVLLFLDWSDS